MPSTGGKVVAAIIIDEVRKVSDYISRPVDRIAVLDEDEESGRLRSSCEVLATTLLAFFFFPWKLLLEIVQ
jgi:hypothetical protein